MKTEHMVSKHLVDEMIKIKFPFSGNPYEVTLMEMLDIMPRIIEGSNLTIIQSTCNGNKNNGTIVEYKGLHVTHCDTPLNALAEMILWLHENNYIKF